MATEMSDAEKARAVSTIHDGRPDPAEDFQAQAADGVVNVKPTKATKAALNKPVGKTR